VPLEELVRSGSVRAITRWGEPVMHTRTRPVTDYGWSLQELLADLFATNAAADGAGLAAPQVGVGLSVFIFDCYNAEWQRCVGLLCNPTITFANRPLRRYVDMEEGCLSLPGAYISTKRPDYAICQGQDQFGDDVEIVGTGMLARCLQHETDHVNGLVFADRLQRRSRTELLACHDRVAAHYPKDWPVTRRT
jgi:peptide deformylase